MLQLVARATCVRPLASRCRVVSRAAAPFSAAVSRPEQNAADVRDLLRTRLSLTEAELDKTMRHGARCARAKIEPKLDWLQTRMDLNAAQLGKLVRKDPTLLTKSILSMDSNRDWLQRFLGPDEAHKLRKVVLRCPSALYYSLEDKIEPLLENLSERLDLKNVKQLRKMVVTHPPLLSYSFENKIAPLLQWLQERKEWQGRATTTRLELDDAELRAVITGNPGILGASVEDNLERKLAFFVREAGVSRSELRDHVVKAPGILTRSLNRYRARLEACRAAGVESHVLSCATATDEKFCKRAGIDPEALAAIRDRDAPPATDGPLALPADNGDVPKVAVGGGPVALEALGPIVINTDGTTALITNWPEMTPAEQANTRRVIVARNKQRLAKLKAAAGEL